MPTNVFVSPMTMQWLIDLQSAPTGAVSRALAGFVDFGRYQRADTDDAIVTILKGLDDAKPYQESLARGIWDWLNERRQFSAAQREAYGLDPFIREIREALIIAQRLDLTSVTKNILADFWRWESWSRKLQLRHSSRDVRLQLLQLCAVHQQVLEDSTLEPRWVQLCRDAGTAIPLAYLDVALLGLRALPREPADDLAPRVAFGLGLWAATFHPAKEDFLQRGTSLRHLMTRADPVWRAIVEDVIGDVCRYASLQDPDFPSPVSEGEKLRVFQAASWWRESVKTQRRTGSRHTQEKPGSSRQKRTQFLSPMPEEGRDLIALAKEGFTDRVLEVTRDLFDRHEQWVRHYGNSYYYHRALTVISPNFIKLSSPRATEILVYYLRRAIMWDEHDAPLWSIWQKCLSRLGQTPVAENVGWEAVRRFPENVPARLQLAQLLVDQNRSQEAESLLREVAHLAPRDPKSCRIFPLVLGKIVAADKERRHEALKLVSAAIKEFPDHHNLLVFAAALYLSFGDNQLASKLLDRAEAVGRSPHYYNVRFRLAYREQGDDEASRWLDLGLQEHPNNAALLKKKRYFENESDDPAGEHDDPLFDFDIKTSTDSDLSFDVEENAGRSGTTEVDHTIEQVIAEEAVPTAHTAAEKPATELSSPPAPSAPQPPTGETSSTARPLIPSTEPAVARQPIVTSGKKEKPKPEPDYAFEEVVRHGRAKRADFALNGAHLRGAERQSARTVLENLVKSDPEFLYGQVIRGRRIAPTNGNGLKGISIPPAVEIEFAVRAGNATFLRRMTTAGVEGLLADLASALAGDKEACERWEKGIPRVSIHEGYASRVLQDLLADLGTSDVLPEQRLQFRMLWKEPVTDISELSHYFFQAIDASLLFSVTDNSARSP